MRVGEARRDLRRDPLTFGISERLARGESVFERPTRKVLEHHVRLAVGSAVVVEACDVRVRERCDRVRLALETLGVGVSGKELHRHVPVELSVVREPDRAHPARSELLLETVSAADRLATGPA